MVIFITLNSLWWGEGKGCGQEFIFLMNLMVPYDSE